MCNSNDLFNRYFNQRKLKEETDETKNMDAAIKALQAAGNDQEKIAAVQQQFNLEDAAFKEAKQTAGIEDQSSDNESDGKSDGEQTDEPEQPTADELDPVITLLDNVIQAKSFNNAKNAKNNKSAAAVFPEQWKTTKENPKFKAVLDALQKEGTQAQEIDNIVQKIQNNSTQ